MVGSFLLTALASVVASVVSVYVIEALRGPAPQTPAPGALASGKEAA